MGSNNSFSGADFCKPKVKNCGDVWNGLGPLCCWQNTLLSKCLSQVHIHGYRRSVAATWKKRLRLGISDGLVLSNTRIRCLTSLTHLLAVASNSVVIRNLSNYTDITKSNVIFACSSYLRRERVPWARHLRLFCSGSEQFSESSQVKQVLSDKPIQKSTSVCSW